MYFEQIQESRTFTSNLHQKKNTEVFPNASFTNKAREKIYAHGVRCENKGTTKYPSSAVRRKYRKFNKYRIRKMLNQYTLVIKSPKLKQSNAWRFNSVPNVYKNLN